MFSRKEKPIIWLGSEIKSPPFSRKERLTAGFYLRKVQEGDILEMPYSKPMFNIGINCYELRINGDKNNWRIIYHVCEEGVVILDVFKKKTKVIPKNEIKVSGDRLKTFYNNLKNE